MAVWEKEAGKGLRGAVPPLPPCTPPTSPQAAAQGQASGEHSISTGLATACGLSLTSQLRQSGLPLPPTSFPPVGLQPRPPARPHCPLLRNPSRPAFSPGRARAGWKGETTHYFAYGRHLINDSCDGLEPNHNPVS